jgi:hypothetical protein
LAIGYGFDGKRRGWGGFVLRKRIDMHCHYSSNFRATRYVCCRPEVWKQCGLSGVIRVSGMNECPQC